MSAIIIQGEGKKEDVRVSWFSQELESGDIIVVQEELSNPNQFPFPTAKSFLQHIKNLRTVVLRRYDQPSKDVAKIRLSKTASYKEVAKAITTKLNIANGPDYIRIFQLFSQVLLFSFFGFLPPSLFFSKITKNIVFLLFLPLIRALVTLLDHTIKATWKVCWNIAETLPGTTRCALRKSTSRYQSSRNKKNLKTSS